jgi:hypothetical protein
MEKGKHPVYQYWPWMLAAATVLRCKPKDILSQME